MCLNDLEDVFPFPRTPANNAFKKGVLKSFDDARKPDGRMSSWAGARGLHAEIWQASVIA